MTTRKANNSTIVAELNGVRKRFPEPFGFGALLSLKRRVWLEVLSGLDLMLESGEILGLVGVNGSGKSTLLRILAGQLLVDGGEVRVFGIDPARSDSPLGGRVGLVLPTERSFFWRLSLGRNLEFFALLNDLTHKESRLAARKVLDRVGLLDAIDRPFRDLSDGMKQRAAVARGLIGEPELLLVDEATRSLDPAAAELVRRLLRQRADYGSAVLAVGHNLDELAGLCDRLALLEEGRISICGPISEVIDEIRGRFEPNLDYRVRAGE